MDIKTRERDILIELCNLALQAKIDVVNFYDKWPYSDIHEDAFLKHLYEDLEDGIQHTPGSLLTGKVLHKEWINLESYGLILLDKTLLEKCTDTQVLLNCRESILVSFNQLCKINIEAEVEKCIGPVAPGVQ
jgi:hypothetical protein